MKRILALTAALCMMIGAVGCGSKDEDEMPAVRHHSGSSESAPESDNNNDDDDESKAEETDHTGYEVHFTEDDLFDFYVPESLSEERNDDYEYCFTNEAETGLIGIMSITGYHQAVEAFGEITKQGHEEDGSYEDLTGEKITVGGRPGYRIGAKCEGDQQYEVNMVQYGNGDIFGIFCAETEGSTELIDIARKMPEMIVYNGEPEKDKAEKYSCDHFKLELGPEWYIRSQSDDSISAGINIQHEVGEAAVSVTVAGFDDMAAEMQLMDDKAKFSEKYDDLMVSNTTFMDHSASLLSFKRDMGTFFTYFDFYYFNEGDKGYRIGITYPEGSKDKVYSDSKSITDTIVFK